LLPLIVQVRAKTARLQGETAEGRPGRALQPGGARSRAPRFAPPGLCSILSVGELFRSLSTRLLRSATWRLRVTQSIDSTGAICNRAPNRAEKRLLERSALASNRYCDWRPRAAKPRWEVAPAEADDGVARPEHGEPDPFAGHRLADRRSARRSGALAEARTVFGGSKRRRRRGVSAPSASGV
jgi:hypothetical protein